MDVSGKVILLVEDEALIGLAEKRQLEACGYTVILVYSGEAAVKAILDENTAIDLILMDINLGAGIDGTETAEQILLNKDVPIVFLSSHIEKEIVEKTENISSYGYVVKNSGIVVLDTSIKMAFKLFESKTAEKEKEASLQKSEALLSLTQHLAKIGGWIQDVENGTVDWTDELYEIHGFNKEDFHTLEEKVEAGLSCFDGEARKKIGEAYGKLVHDGIPYSLELPFTSRTGEKKWIWSVTRAVFEQEKPKQLYGYFMDITDKVKVEDDNRFIHAILEAEHNASLDGILVVDSNRQILSYNKKFCEIFDVPDQLIEQKDDFLLLAHAATRVTEAEAFKVKINYLYNHPEESERNQILLKNSSCYDQFSTPIVDDRGDYLGRVWFLHDITLVKQSEEQAREQAVEKELLLKEVNHRIKNNIDSIGNLLKLQAESIEDGPAVGILQDAISRVHSMRVIYDKLFVAESYTFLSASLYVGDLLKALFDMFPRSNTLEISIDLDDFDMNIKDLFALGLIVNELVTNSMKYAFPHNSRGSLSVSVKKTAEVAVLKVLDSGNGLNTSVLSKTNADQKGFGLMLVSILAEQLEGAFSQQQTEDGFLSELRFELTPNERSFRIESYGGK